MDHLSRQKIYSYLRHICRYCWRYCWSRWMIAKYLNRLGQWIRRHRSGAHKWSSPDDRSSSTSACIRYRWWFSRKRTPILCPFVFCDWMISGRCRQQGRMHCPSLRRSRSAVLLGGRYDWFGWAVLVELELQLSMERKKISEKSARLAIYIL